MTDYIIEKNTNPKVDIQEAKETLGNIIATFTFFPSPEHRIRHVEAMMSMITAMLHATGRFKYYESKLRNIRDRYRKAVNVYDIDDGWRDTQTICADLEAELTTIAFAENLVKLNADLFMIGKPSTETVDEDGTVIRR